MINQSKLAERIAEVEEILRDAEFENFSRERLIECARETLGLFKAAMECLRQEESDNG